MADFITVITAGGIAMFSTIVGSFSGGATSLIMFPLMLIFVMSNYVDAFTLNKIATLFMTISASRLHSKKHKINFRLFFTLLIFGIIGTALGTYLIQYKLNEDFFKKLLAVCLIIIAVYLLASKNKGVESRIHREIGIYSLLIVAVFSTFINILNGIFGGTGLFLTIFFVIFFRMTFIESMIYTMPVYAIINIFQVPYLAYITDIIQRYPILTITMICCGLLGGIIGTKLQYLKGNGLVKKVAVVIMIAIGLKTFIG